MGKAAVRRSMLFQVMASVTVTLYSFALSAQTPKANQPLPVLKRADQIRHLTPEQADAGYPVRIRGVITNDVPAPDFVIEDSSAGIYVVGNRTQSFPHHLGDVVEIDGVSGEGRFAPIVVEKSSRVLGKGTLPEARLYSFGELIGGQLDSQWVKTRGVVRSVSVDRISWREPALDINLVTGGQQFKARVPILDSQQDWSSWVGSEVSITGVCGSLSDASRQLVGLIFYVPRVSFIKLMGKAHELPAAGLLRFSPDQSTLDRVRVQGVVTYQQRGKAVFLMIAGRGLRVLTHQDTPLEVGDVIDVLGFPAMGESEPVLEDATFQRIGHQSPPNPIDLIVSAPFERYDGALVSAKATLLERHQQPDGLNLVLEQNGFAFTATVPPDELNRALLSIPLRSELRIVGICLVRNGGVWHNPVSFVVLIRRPRDVVVLQTPPWWNMHHSLWLLAILTGTLLGVFAWVVMLRGRLREQVGLYHQKLHSGAILEERHRIARELHDTLEQDLAGISLQLDLAVDCFERALPLAQQAVVSARNMSRHSIVEARRSVWDLRCHLLENGDLAYALGQVADLLVQRDEVCIDVRVEGGRCRLPSPLELNILRIGQEAMTNAVKHAEARNVSVALVYQQQKVCLRVTDNGRGFVPDQTPSGSHFGLFDMRERAQAMGSKLKIVSEIGLGTSIEVEVAVKGQDDVHKNGNKNSRRR